MPYGQMSIYSVMSCDLIQNIEMSPFNICHGSLSMLPIMAWALAWSRQCLDTRRPYCSHAAGITQYDDVWHPDLKTQSL